MPEPTLRQRKAKHRQHAEQIITSVEMAVEMYASRKGPIGLWRTLDNMAVQAQWLATQANDTETLARTANARFRIRQEHRKRMRTVLTLHTSGGS